MAAVVVVLAVSLFCASLCASSFTVGNSTPPYPNYGMAIGYDISNNTVLLFGGDPNTRQFTLFKNNHFVDGGEFFLTEAQSTYSVSQHYTQINDHLWVIRYDGDGFIKINTKTPYTVETPSIVIPTNVGNGGCLTSMDDYLIVLSALDLLGNLVWNYVQIYRLSDEQWLSNVPYLTSPKSYLSCVTVGAKVYAIGGYGGGSYFNTIDVLDLSNIDSGSFPYWSSLSATLTIPRDSTRAVVYGTYIYVVGGMTTADMRVSDVDIIDTITETVVAYHPLHYALIYPSCIVVRNTLFVFGGNVYQYSTLPTSNPTSSPTDIPTQNPTSIEPTAAPSNYPTVATTTNPTEDTTIDPTTNPSDTPTKDPTLVASMHPTADPSNAPAKDATLNPNIHPTAYSTLLPIFQTELPSFGPIQEKEVEVPEIPSTTDVSSQEISVNAAKNNTALVSTAVVLGIVCVICCIVSFGAYYSCVWKRESKSSNENNIQNMGSNIEGDAYVEDRTGKNMQMSKVVAKDGVVLSNEPKHIPYIASSDKMVNDSEDDDDLIKEVNATIGRNALIVANKAKSEAVNALNVNCDKNDDIIQRIDSDDDLLEEVNATIGGNELITGSGSYNKANMEAVNAIDDDYMLENAAKRMEGNDESGRDTDNDIVMPATGEIYGEKDGFDRLIDEDQTGHDVNEDGAKEVHLWLNSIGFMKYYNVFIQNGFDSMDFVKEINDVKDLDGIGISLRAHQLKIVNHIKKLNQQTIYM